MQLKRYALIKTKNLFGWKTDRKILVFVVDDYGNVRVASRMARENLKKAGLQIDGNKFDMFDALEDANDLVALYETLASVKDKNNNPAVFTAMSIPANINFEKMRQENYQRFHYELLPETWSKKPDYEQVPALWKEGIANRLIYPQFHGREHLNVKVLMTNLQNRDKETITCFEHDSYAGISSKPFKDVEYVAAFQFQDFSDNDYLKNVIKEGLEAFTKVFGFRAKHFAAPGAREHRVLAEPLKEGGIEFIDNDWLNKEHQGNGKYRYQINYTGKRNRLGQTYLLRNCVFEPSPYDNIDWVSYCMQQIDIAFKTGCPAIISSHRVNFAGHIDETNRKKGLDILKQLLQKIVSKWPDVEFMTSVELGEAIKKSRLKNSRN